MKDEFWQSVRYLLIAGGTYLASTGKIPATDPTVLADAVIQIAGGLITVGSIGWGLYVRWRTKSVPVEALPASVPTISTATGLPEK